MNFTEQCAKLEEGNYIFVSDCHPGYVVKVDCIDTILVKVKCAPGDIVSGTIYEIDGTSANIPMDIIDPGYTCDLATTIGSS